MKIEPEKGDFIKIIFNDRAVVEEGTVVLWSEEKAVLKSLNSDDVLIIYKPFEKLLAVQISIQNKEKPLLNVAVTEEIEPETYIREPGLRAKKLVELRQLQAKEEKENARKLLTSFRANGLPQVEYGFPGKKQ